MYLSQVLYMSSSCWLLGVESHDFSQDEKGWTVCKAEQIHKMTITYFHSKQQPRTILSENSCHLVNLLSFASSSFFLSMRKIMWLNSQQPKTRGHVKHPNPILQDKNVEIISLWIVVVIEKKFNCKMFLKILLFLGV